MRYFAFAVLALATAAPAQPAGGFRVAESGQAFYRLDDAVKSIGEGSGTIVVAPGRYTDCASFGGANLTIRAATPSSAIFDGGACEGKATLVFKGTSATVDGLVFQNIRVADRNGSGIRLERGNLNVIRSTFRDSEQGILSNDDPAASVIIDRSTFSGLGGCPGGMCSHSVYLGRIASLSITRSRFERGTGGHYVKSRSARVSITDSSFDDSHGRARSASAAPADITSRAARRGSALPIRASTTAGAARPITRSTCPAARPA